MLRKMFSFGGLLLLAGAAIMATPGSGWAQRGGGRGGGAHIGGARIGGGNFGGARFRGSNSGVFRGGYHNYYRPYYGSYGYGYPYYGSYGYSYPSYTPYPDVGSSPTYDPGYSGYEGDVTPSYPDGYQAYYPPDAAPAQPDNTAHVIVSLPSDAELLFDGTKTTSAGSVREYQSPPLTPGRRYTYELRARWSENGQEVTQTQQVGVTAGAHVNVSFPVPPRPTAAAVK